MKTYYAILKIRVKDPTLEDENIEAFIADMNKAEKEGDHDFQGNGAIELQKIFDGDTGETIYQ